MSRSRIIKPCLWINEDLAELSIPARYLFPALWCHADREGRLEYRPKKLKAEIFPYDNLLIEKLVVELHDGGFITVYSKNDNLYIQITNFVKHQRPHPNETASNLPEMITPCFYDVNLKKFLLVQLNEDSCNLISNSDKTPLSYSYSNSDVNDEKGQADACKASSSIVKNICPYEEIRDLYQKLCVPPLPNCLVLSDERKSHIRIIWQKAFPTLDDWEKYFKQVAVSDFLCGKVLGKEFHCSFDWLINKTNMIKICEGNYDNKR